MNRKKFFDAAAHWDVETVSAGLREDRGLARVVDERGRTALHRCARTNGEKDGRDVAASLRVAKALLKAGANPDAVHDIPNEGGSFKATPLWYAVAWGRNPRLVQLLLDDGASPRGCLWACVWANDVEMAKTLVKAGAPLNEASGGETPLAYATRLRRPAFYRILGGR
ncbi:MAG TPA: ankyrin repeat domain-containing protein [Thermoanaerobaculia bacterium]|nr:ankyrin repeat domain-containing protein [Thermoanaerobaculia bacterium]